MGGNKQRSDLLSDRGGYWTEIKIRSWGLPYGNRRTAHASCHQDRSRAEPRS